jgi:hypothetical protein
LVLAALMFAIVFRHPRRLVVVSLVAIVAFAGLNLLSGRHLLPNILIRPTPIALAEQYTQALAADDLPAAQQLTDGSAGCDQLVTETFQEDQVLLLRVLGEDWQSGPLPQTLVEGIITFYDEHQPQHLVFLQITTEDGKTGWLSLRMRYSPYLGARHICGSGVELGYSTGRPCLTWACQQQMR